MPGVRWSDSVGEDASPRKSLKRTSMSSHPPPAAAFSPSGEEGGGGVSLYTTIDEGERQSMLDDIEYALDGCQTASQKPMDPRTACRLAALVAKPAVRAVIRTEHDLLVDVAAAACSWAHDKTHATRFASASLLASLCVSDGDAAAFSEQQRASDVARAFAGVVGAGPVCTGGGGDAEAEAREPLSGVLARARKDKLLAAVGGHEWRRPPPTGRANAALRLDADPRAYALACLERLLAPTSQSAARQAASNGIKEAVRSDVNRGLLRALLSLIAISRDGLEPRSDAWTTTMLLRGALRALVELTFVDHDVVSKLWSDDETEARKLIWSVLSGSHAFAKPRVHRPAGGGFAHVEASLLRDGSLTGEVYQEATKLLINVTQASADACEESVTSHHALTHALEVVAACCSCADEHGSKISPREDTIEVMKMALCLLVNLLESSSRARFLFTCGSNEARSVAILVTDATKVPSSKERKFSQLSPTDFLCALVWNDDDENAANGGGGDDDEYNNAGANDDVVTAADLERTERVSQLCIVQMYAALALGVLVVSSSSSEPRPQAHGARASSEEEDAAASARAHAAVLASVDRAASGSSQGGGGWVHLSRVLTSLRDFHRHTGTLTESQMGALTHVVREVRRRSEMDGI
ncbi:hypothetical protein PPROV_000643000 [Pycnococcus provasolii]|uniref:Wings apart-like protein C-terminal domain-containing protein n=1 Tax=Pycnococcus provasolii TaxID=41880 RepID=A0A830HLE3_9CHLO|nr:hypothetical protein PPROV_000643000 [Pycnococcus provasolii]